MVFSVAKHLASVFIKLAMNAGQLLLQWHNDSRHVHYPKVNHVANTVSRTVAHTVINNVCLFCVLLLSGVVDLGYVK